MSAVPKRRRLGRSEEEEREKGEEKANDDAVEHRPRTRVGFS